MRPGLIIEGGPIVVRNRFQLPDGSYPPMAGAGATVAAAAELAYQHPLAPPTLGPAGTVTVDVLLQNPTRVTRQLINLTSQRFIADRIFASSGGVTGGAVIYDVNSAANLYSGRDVEEVTPGSEFPIVTGERLVPNVALVRKYGGKVFITDEARDRNDTGLFNREIQKLANTIVRKINRIAVAVLQAAGVPTMASIRWDQSPNPADPAADLSKTPWATFVQVENRPTAQTLGITYNLVLLNSQEVMTLQMLYGPSLPALLQSAGISIYKTDDIPKGTGWWVSEGDAGQMRTEKALSTETWREEKTERTWSQSSVRPVMFVDNPEAVVQVTGIGPP